MSPEISGLPGMIGQDPAMLAVADRVRLVAPEPVAVLVVGETGTGKELVARALHQLSPRGRWPFVALNCATIQDALAEAQLFGVEPGAYTGAPTRRQPGALRMAHQGTVFLDELDSTAAGVQAKLLRASEYREFRPVGGGALEHSDFRLVGAIARPPEELVATHVLRVDLYYRFEIVLHLPPLRQRGGDVLLLARHFLAEGPGNGRRARTLTSSAERALQRYLWPGNVRELRRVIQGCLWFADGDALTGDDIEREILHASGRTAVPERDRLLGVLESHGWNASRAARSLGLGRTKLYELLRRHAITRPRGRAEAET
jgi:transcriptional regulator with PAS, ATPase and Fis domain